MGLNQNILSIQNHQGIISDTEELWIIKRQDFKFKFVMLLLIKNGNLIIFFFNFKVSERYAIKFKRCTPDAKVPQRQTKDSAGSDHWAAENKHIKPRCRELIKTQLQTISCWSLWNSS